LNWARMNGAAASAPGQIAISYIPFADGEATWATAEGFE
jgi:hypothetical protein